MEFAVSKRSLRAKIIAQSFPDLEKGFRKCGSVQKLTDVILNSKIDLFKVPNGLSDCDVENLILNAPKFELQKSIIGALRGFSDKRKYDCEFSPLMAEDEYKKVLSDTHLSYLQKAHEDSFWTDEEKDFVFGLYRNGKSQKRIHSHYLKCCDGGEYYNSNLELNLRPKSLGAVYQMIGREIACGNLKRHQFDWSGDLGFAALWLKGLEKKEKSYRHVERVRQNLNSYFYGGEDIIKYNHLAGFFDSVKNRESFKGLEKQLVDFEN